MSVFHWADYVVFVAAISASMATGLFFACRGRGQKTAEEFFMAGRTMAIYPVGFSIFVSWMSAISFIGDPVECYRYGFIYIMLVAGYVIAPFPAGYFAKKFHELKIVSCYEYIELRYGRPLRIFCSTLFTISLVLWLGIATYAPAIALSQASGIPVWLSIVLIGTVSTFYTALGGMKAVIWADTIQLIVMLLGQIAIVVRGTIVAGGLSEVFRIATEGGRINYRQSVVDFNPLTYASFWVYFIGGFHRVFNSYISNQILVQRFSTVPTPRDAKRAVFLTSPILCVMSSLIAFSGLVMYAVYHDCDPLLSGRIQQRDQMVPLLVIELLGFLPGIPGLFLAALFSASISSFSSGINGISAMILSDMLTPYYNWRYGKPIPSNVAAVIAKTLGAVFGVLITCFSFLPMALGSSIFALTSMATSLGEGPVAGLFFMGMLFPKINSKFITVGFGISLLTIATISSTSLIMPLKHDWEQLPLSTAGCYKYGNFSGGSDAQYTTAHVNVTDVGTKPAFHFLDLYQLNPLLYYGSALLIVILISYITHLIVSCLLRVKRQKQMEPTTKETMYDVTDAKGENIALT